MTPLFRTIVKIVLVLIFIPILWWLVTSLYSDEKSKPREVIVVPQATSTDARALKSASPSRGERAVDSLIVQDGNYQCELDQIHSGSRGHDAIYLGGGRLRAEFRTKSGNVTKAIFWVYDGRFLYTWKGGAAVGTKVAITSLKELPATIPENLVGGRIYGTTFESDGWICHPWIEETELLMPSSGIKFKF